MHVAADQPGRDDVDLASLVVGVPFTEGVAVADRGDRLLLDDDGALGDDGLGICDDSSGDQHIRLFLTLGV